MSPLDYRDHCPGCLGMPVAYCGYCGHLKTNWLDRVLVAALIMCFVGLGTMAAVRYMRPEIAQPASHPPASQSRPVAP